MPLPQEIQDLPNLTLLKLSLDSNEATPEWKPDTHYVEKIILLDIDRRTRIPWLITEDIQYLAELWHYVVTITITNRLMQLV